MVKTKMDFSAFVDSYIECALWASHSYGENGEDNGNLDDFYGAEDIDRESRHRMRQDCAQFIGVCYSNGLWEIADNPNRAGFDFWLNRNGHGSGFWDGPWKDGSKLSDIAKTFGGSDLLENYDGTLSIS